MTVHTDRTQTELLSDRLAIIKHLEEKVHALEVEVGLLRIECNYKKRMLDAYERTLGDFYSERSNR